jgi:transglutaminase-like putative cysteine protease
MLRFPFLLVFISFYLSPFAVSQTKESIKLAKPKADYSQEAFVIEQFYSKNQFENDGTSTEENTARFRIQSEAGAQRYGVLSFSYASGTGNFELVYVRVRKPDGSVVETPPENVQDMAANITREAPFYSDIHEKHVAVKGLGVGDELEYQVREHTTKPLAPGQFWTAYRFTREQITLDERLEIRVPRGRVVKVKSTTIQPIISDLGEYRTYTWHNANLESKDESADKRLAIEQAWQQARGRLPHPDVMISSFLSWDEVGRWYGGLQEERVKPTTDVTAKAAELTKNSITDEARMRALYKYVSTQFRYIGIAFGIGRYQPHSAAEVMENQYGDCKDKHTLLASLLTAAGIPAYPALISTTNEVDADVPSPGQFNHVITVVPRASGLVWLDSTAEVGPYEYLISPLRDKHALAIWKDKPATLENTPVDLKNGTLQTFNMTAKLSDDGTLVGQADMSAKGDEEFLLRAGFRSVPLPQWKDLVQRISQSLGFGGEVSAVTASSPEKTEEPFHLDYTYTRKKFGDWDSKRIVTPMPFITLPVPSDDEFLPLGPLFLGSLSEVQFDSQVELPKGYRPELPEAVHLKRDFAQFDVTYEFKDGKLFGEQHLKTSMREVPASEREQLKEFVKAVHDNYGVFIQLTTGSGTSETSVRYPSAQSMSSLRNLPDSENREAVQLEQEAREDMKKHDMQAATTSLYRAVSADPKFTRAWIMLGALLLTQKQVEAGVDAFHKAIATDPDKPAIVKALGVSLTEAGQFEDAVKSLAGVFEGQSCRPGRTCRLGRMPHGAQALSRGCRRVRGGSETRSQARRYAREAWTSLPACWGSRQSRRDL